MTENEFEKTVKLPAGGSVPTQNSSPSAEDKTLRLTPEHEKTVKLSAVPSAPPMGSASASDQEKAAVSPPPPPPSEISLGKSNRIKVFGMAISIAVIILVGAWFFLPNWFRGRAEKLAKEGKHSDSAKQLQRALYFFPLKSDTFLIFLGREQRLSKDILNSQKTLEKLIRKNPTHFQALRELGQTLREAGQNQKAFDLFQKCIQLKPGDNEALQWSAQLAFELKNYSATVSAYEILTKSGMLEANDWYQLGVSYYALGKLEESANALQTAWEKNKTLKGVNALLAKIYLSQEKFAEGVSLYKLELSLAPDDPLLAETFAETCLQAGTSFLSQKKLNDALPILQEGLSVPSKNSSALHYELAIAFTMSRKKKDALSHLSEAVQTDPTLKAQAKKEPAFAAWRKSPDFAKIVR